MSNNYAICNMNRRIILRLLPVAAAILLASCMDRTWDLLLFQGPNSLSAEEQTVEYVPCVPDVEYEIDAVYYEVYDSLPWDSTPTTRPVQRQDNVYQTDWFSLSVEDGKIKLWVDGNDTGVSRTIKILYISHTPGYMGEKLEVVQN